MRDIKLLDCTLRDGGYLNDWEFGHSKIINIYERLIASGVEMIEIGFLDDRRPYDVNRTIFPDTASIRESFKSTTKRPPVMVGMIDYGTCSIDNLEDRKDSILDGIRVIFKKHLMDDAMAFVKQIKDKGYIVTAQLVAVSEYTDEDIAKISKLVNEVRPMAVSMVDTYGLLYPDTMLDLYKKLDAAVDKDIYIGFHAHNNLQLGYANAMAFIRHETDRNIIVDGTLYGMGKSAGNDPIELVAPFLNENCGKNYNVAPMLEVIEESIKEIYIRSPWGYRTQFYLSAENECHPN
nr:aldolase catalytic domain-containing protein [Lachnospiraceae bacterium]